MKDKKTSQAQKAGSTRWYQGIYFRFGASCLVVLALVAVVNIFITARIWVEVAEDVEQRRNWNLAENIALELQPRLAKKVDEKWLKKRFFFYSQLYPSVNFYLLDEFGQLMVQSHGSTKTAESPGVPLGQILAATKPVTPSLPIRSLDPVSGDATVFSVSKTTCDAKPCYLYLTLTSGLFNMLQDTQGQYHIIRYALIILLAGVGLMVFLSLGLFVYLSGGFREMLTVVRSIEGGDYSKKIPIRGNDEIAEISRAINSMSDAVEESVVALANTDRQRRELIANISHDLRGPLTVIEGFMETILKKHNELSSEEQLGYLERIYRNILQQKQLTTDLFELSKLEAKEKTPNYEEFSVLELVYDSVQTYRPQAEDSEMQLLVAAKQDPGTVFADISMIDRVLTNLISNAIRYCPPKTKIVVDVVDSENRVKVIVEDDGQGIAPEDVVHIFESFYRVDKDRNRVRGGTGLGLAIVKKMLESHGSDIVVSSEVGCGTRFEFELEKA